MITPGPATSSLRLLRRGLGVQRAYGAAIARLSAEYVRTMLALARGAGDPGAPALTPSIVLEGEAGAMAAGRFLVENHLGEPISAPVCVSPFTSKQGHEVDVRLQFDPAVVTLQPREQQLVRVGARIDEQLADAEGYRGVLGVPGLPGTELGILVRRRATPHPERDGADLEPRSFTGWDTRDRETPFISPNTSKRQPRGSP